MTIRKTAAAPSIKRHNTLTSVVVGTLVLTLCTCDQAVGIAVEITRRDLDIYYLYQNDTTNSMVCNEDISTTYLVNENQCVSNETLFDGKR